MILFLDPSSSCIGYAVYTPGGEAVEFGRVTPSSSKVAADPLLRIPDLAAQLAAVLVEHEPSRVVIEVTTGKVHRRIRGASGGAGLGTYGMGVGYVWGVLAGDGYEVEPVLEQRWTRGASKERRAWAVAQRFRGRGYDPADDPGLDVADAIGLAEWWFVERQQQEQQRALAGRKGG